MSIKDYLYFLRNGAKLKKTIVEILDTYARDLPPNLPSYKEDLMPILNSWIKDDAKNISTWRDFDTDYSEIAHSMIVRAINKILDNFRLSGGINLSVRYMYDSYKWLLHKCCKWALSKGFLSKKDYDDYKFLD